MKTIKLVNKGIFNFKNLVQAEKNKFLGSGKCGWPDKNIYKYEVELKGLESVLNATKSFILDVDAIDEYFTSRYGNNKRVTTMSCEQIAIQALNEIVELVELKDCLVYCRVKISATAYSYFEAEWSF